MTAAALILLLVAATAGVIYAKCRQIAADLNAAIAELQAGPEETW